MTTKRFWGILALVGCFGVFFAPAVTARSLIGERGIPIVNDPKDLQLVDLKPLSQFLYGDLKNKGVFGPIRRQALNYKAGRVGIPDPRRQALHLGCVVEKNDQGNTAVLVLAGDLTFKNIRAAIEKDYREYMSRNKGTPQVSEDELGGIKLVKFGYSERPYEVRVMQIPATKFIVVSAGPNSDYELLESTIDVLLGKEKLNEGRIDSTKAQTTFTLSPLEIERIVTFNRPRGSLRKTFAAGMKSMTRKLGIPHSDNESVPLEERIRGQLGLTTGITVQYQWDTDSRQNSSYEIGYTIDTKSTDAAEALRGLISEQITRLAEKTPHGEEVESLGRLTVHSENTSVRLNFLLDTPEAQYQHLSLLLSQLFQYKSMMSFLDRFGRSDGD